MHSSIMRSVNSCVLLDFQSGRIKAQSREYQQKDIYSLHISLVAPLEYIYIYIYIYIMSPSA